MSKLIQEVSAQSGPTFPYEGPFEDPGNITPGTQADITLTANISTLQVSGSVTCDLGIQSGNNDVQAYSIQISFDPSILEVVDANASLGGIQINFLDSFASIQTNSADNTTGTITLEATVSGTAQTVNKTIAQITFRAKRTGTSVVSINKAQSSVTGETGTDILGSTTSLNFTVTGQTTTISGGDLPPSGLSSTFAVFGSFISGLLLLYIGIKTIVDRKRGKGLEM